MSVLINDFFLFFFSAMENYTAIKEYFPEVNCTNLRELWNFRKHIMQPDPSGDTGQFSLSLGGWITRLGGKCDWTG